MVSEHKIQIQVNNFIESLRKESRIEIQNGLITPKKAIIHNSTGLGRRFNYIPGEFAKEEGFAYTHNGFGERTVFRQQPFEVGGNRFYLELKGYGFSGKHFYPFHHGEGDLSFGMYFRNAKHEFGILKSLSRIEGIKTQLPVALLSFPKKEFERNAIAGMVYCCVPFSFTDIEKFTGLPIDNQKDLIDHLISLYDAEGLDPVLKIMNGFSEFDFSDSLGQFPKIKKPAGYLIRATRSPFRLADCSDPAVREFMDVNSDESSFKEAAFEAGGTYVKMLEQGFFHNYPHEKNITTAGELMDFEDTSRITNVNEIKDIWKYVRGFFPEKDLSSFKNYLSHIVGYNYHPLFGYSFLKGTGFGRTPDEVATNLVREYKDTFRELLEERVLAA